MITWRGASRAEQGLPFAREAALAKRLGTDKGMQIGLDGVQLLGGHGYTKEHPVERWYRDLRAIGVAELAPRGSDIVIFGPALNNHGRWIVRDDSPYQGVADLRGRTIATGAVDSPQATLIPLLLLQDAGLDPRTDATIRRYDVRVGLHGDHVRLARSAATLAATSSGTCSRSTLSAAKRRSILARRRARDV